jgi:hypothetical protein
MNLDKYLSDNFDEILDNPDEFVNNNNDYKNNSKISNSYNLNEIDDIDEKEYNDYNSEYFDNINEYFDINYNIQNDNINDDDDDNNDDIINNNNYYKLEEKYKKIEEKQNEDDCEDDIIDELYEKMYETSQPKIIIDDIFNNFKQSKNIKNENIDENINENILKENKKILDNIENFDNDDGFYFFNIMNIFMKFYNNKFDKKDHFFSNINDINKDTTSQMELFFDIITEYKIMGEQMKLNNNELMNQIFTEMEPEKISKIFEKSDKQIYMFEMNELKLFSPSLLVCLNYVFKNNIINDNWNIYNLRDN